MAVDVKGPITGLRELQDLQTSKLRERLAKKAVSNNCPALFTINVDDNLDLQVKTVSKSWQTISINFRLMQEKIRIPIPLMLKMEVW